MRLKTFHGTDVILDADGRLAHSANPGIDELSAIGDCVAQLASLDVGTQPSIERGPLAGCLVIILPDGYLSFRKGQQYLCAEPSSPLLSFSRLQINVWEQFRLFIDDAAIVKRTNLTNIRLGSGSLFDVYATVTDSSEYLPPPLASSIDDTEEYFRSCKHFYPIVSGDRHIPCNEVRHGARKFISTRCRAHGSIFDISGFYHNNGFLYLRPDMERIIVTQFDYCSVDVDYITAKHRISGVFCCPFNGNSPNYYHWLLEGMVSLLLLREAGIDAPPIIVVDGRGLLAWQSEYLALAGITKYLVISGETVDAVLVDELYWLDQRDLPAIGGAALRRLSRFISERVPGIDSEPRRIYVKRLAGGRVVKNAEEVDALLIEKGFVVLVLEHLTVSQQIAAFRSADLIVGPHGAGLSNLIYAREGSCVLELLPEGETRNFFWILSAKVGIDYTFLRCASGGNFDGWMDVDTAALSKKIDALLETRSGSLRPAV